MTPVQREGLGFPTRSQKADMTVLILSTVADVHAQAVMDALEAQGAMAELVDLSEFPTP
jgi:hypothetical protein